MESDALNLPYVKSPLEENIRSLTPTSKAVSRPQRLPRRKFYQIVHGT